MKKAIIFIAIAVLIISVAGCKKTAEKIAEKAIESQSEGKAEVDISEDRITITSKGEGKEETIEFSGGKDLDLPDEFPKDMPVYPGAEVASTWKMGAGNFHTVLRSEEEGEKVFEFYLKKMKKEGWKVGQEMKIPPNYTLGGTKGNRQFRVGIGAEEDGSTISISLTEKEG